MLRPGPFSHAIAVFAILLAALASGTGASQTFNTTAAGTDLFTWWHDEGEINWETAVQDEHVRQSHIYSAWVSSSAGSDDIFYQSFVYETIPRNGQGNILIPGDPSSVTDADDSISIEADIWITMAWTSFLYSTDAVVKIARSNNASSASNVVIRPSNLGLNVTDDGEGNVYIHVPYREEGFRFSVEFQDALYSYRDACNVDKTVCDFVQDWHPDGPNYFANLTEDNPVMSVEPHDALLIFASPFLPADLVPDPDAADTYTVYPGRVPDLSQITNAHVVFAPGVHYMTSTAHTVLSASVSWVHLDAGAYVKGAIQFTTAAATIKATGHGVLSGEQYVYQANPTTGYTNSPSNDDCLRMWSGHSAAGTAQTFVLRGPTTNAPPFNSVDFTGDTASIRIAQRDYKQVGAFFGQTDGTTLYAGSSLADTFYHSNDDTIKTYGSHISVRDVVVWKGKTAPTIQFGWAHRNLTNITVDGVDIIHMKYSSNASHPSLIGANQLYAYTETDTTTADLGNTIRDVYFGNIRAEGVSGNLLRIVPLANYVNVTIENVSIDEFGPASTGMHQSQLPLWFDAEAQVVSISGFSIKNFAVAGEAVDVSLANYGPDALGALNIAPGFLSGHITITQ